MQFIFKMKTEEDDEAFEILSFEKFKDTNKNEKKKQHVLEFKRACMCMCVCVQIITECSKHFTAH